MTSTIERRYVPAQMELRTDGSKAILEGYAAVFGKRSQNLGGFVEQVNNGAFTKTLKDGADVRALLNHDPNFVLGRSTSGTLRMAQDDTGLHYEVTLGEQSYARDLAISLERGDITQSSFGFRTISDDWGFTDDEFPLRTLREVALGDVSPVTYPAYLDATSGLGQRALDRLAETRGMRPGAITASGLVTVLRAAPEAPERAVKARESIALRAAASVGADDDANPVAVAKALDAVIDEAIDVLDEVGVPAGSPLEQLDALLDAADIVADQLLTLLGAADPADSDDVESPSEPEQNSSTHGLTFRRAMPLDPKAAMLYLTSR